MSREESHAFLRRGVGAPRSYKRPPGGLKWDNRATAWIVTGHGVSMSILGSKSFQCLNAGDNFARLTTRARTPMPCIEGLLRVSLFFNGEADHRNLRSLLVEAMNAQPLSAYAPLMKQIAVDLWQSAKGKDRFDIVTEYAELLPSKIAAAVFGLAESQREAFFRATYGLMAIYNRGCSLRVYRDFESRLAGLLPLIDQLFAERRARPGRDGITRFVSKADQLGLTSRQAASAFVFLYLAAVDQTSASVSLAVMTLAQNPTLLSALRDGRVKTSAFIDELLRLESPAPQVVRVAVEDVEVGGSLIRAGQEVIILVGAANRDPAVFTKPDEIDVNRKPNRHLAFSAGPHACLGAAFARAELDAALRPILLDPPTAILIPRVDWWKLDATRRIRSLPARVA